MKERGAVINDLDPARAAQRLRWALTAYQRATSALLRRGGLSDVAADVCQAIVGREGYILAAVALAEPGPEHPVRVVASAGPAVGYLEGLALSGSADRVAGQGPTGIAIRTGQAQIMGDARTDPRFGPWRDRAAPYGIRSSTTVPFDGNGVVSGVLLVYANAPDAFGAPEMDLFQRLGEELAFVLALQADRQALAVSQQALAAQQLEFKNLADQIQDVIVRYDPDSRIDYISPAVAQFGYAPEDLIGRRLSDLVHPDDLAAGAARNARLIAGDLSVRAQADAGRIRRKDGTYVWVEGNAAPLRNADGAITGSVVVLRDITQRRALEAELQRKYVEADAAAAAKAQFLANMSHEIRTPLTGVLGFTGLLRQIPDLPERARRYIDRIDASGRDLLTIVNDVMDFSRLEAGKIELDLQAFDLDALLREVLEDHRGAAERKGLALTLARRAPAGLVLRSDVGRLRQVLGNLISNAIKFTPEGSVTLAVEAEAGGGLRFAVTDTGVGISAETAPRLFEHFSQADETDTRQHGGAGLGLAICKGLVDLLGGQIGVDSIEGRGSTFWFVIPAPRLGAAAAVETGGSAPALSPLRILVVDDVAVNRELVLAMLAPFDLDLTEASNGLEAVEASLNAGFDLILMDLQMPGMDGLAATQAIRANSDLNRRTPIVALSANVMPPQVEACLSAGMNDHIGKPIQPGELLNKIAYWTDPPQAA